MLAQGLFPAPAEVLRFVQAPGPLVSCRTCNDRF